MNRGLSLALMLGLVIVGCSQRQWYEGMKAGNRHECLRLPVADQAECLDRIEPDYEAYRRSRESTGSDDAGR